MPQAWKQGVRRDGLAAANERLVEWRLRQIQRRLRQIGRRAGGEVHAVDARRRQGSIGAAVEQHSQNQRARDQPRRLLRDYP